MNDFVFQNTTKVYFGRDQLGHLHEEVLAYGDKILVASGGTYIEESPLYARVLDELRSGGITVFELGPVEPNPRHTTVNRSVKICRENDVKAVLAIGGGSTIDCCKAIAATTLSATDDIWDLVEGTVAWSDALAVFTMPTIASTGSEMDKSCVIANEDLGVKSGIAGEPIRPRVSFLDPTATFTVPTRQTACGGFDIMCHMLDMNYFVNIEKYPLQFGQVEALLRTVRTYAPVAVAEPENYEARATMLWAASWALNSFMTSGFKTQASLHALEQFSAVLNMTHGLGLAIVAPKWMRYLLDRDETVASDFARLGVNVMGIEPAANDVATARAAIDALQSYITDELGLPATLTEAGADCSRFDEMADKAMGGADVLDRAYRPLTKADCLAIYEMCR